jgi:lysophospholipase L1-like esterase
MKHLQSASLATLARTCLIAIVGTLHCSGLTWADDGKIVTLKHGDRVVFLGDAFFEREYEDGYIETAITSRFPELRLTFRNLGWTGDTVWGDSRAGFDTAKEGFSRRAAVVKELKPNVILLSCGMNESFAGAESLPKFEEGLNALLDSLSETKAKIILISPISHENLGPPMPDPEPHNRNLKLYRDAMKRIAAERGAFFLDLIAQGIGYRERSHVANAHETTDGIHLSALGYFDVAAKIASVFDPQLGEAGSARWEVNLRRDGRPQDRAEAVFGTALSDVVATASGVRFRSQDRTLPDPPAPKGSPAVVAATFRTLSVDGLDPGSYVLRVDEAVIAEDTAEHWAAGVASQTLPEFDQAETLRRVIVEKNQQLFHRLRPQNETYLYLFRKHEQGHMSGEIPQFDPLIAEKEAEIDRLKKPVPHTYELKRVEEGKK